MLRAGCGDCPYPAHQNSRGVKLMINLQSECFVEDNDIYVLECHHGIIIVNNNYSGINLYNKNLELLSTIDIFEGILIHTVYKNPYKNEVILYCPDNKVFVYLNIDTAFQKVIDFNADIDECGLSNIYFWSGHEVIMLCGNKRYYRIDTSLFSLQELDMLGIEKEYPTVHKMLNDSSKYLIFEGGTEKLTYKDRINNEIVNFDYMNDIKIVSKIPNKLGHEVIYLNGIFLSVHEEFIQAIKEGNEVARIDTVSPNIFLKARKLTEQSANFIVLRGIKSNAEQCFLSHYYIN
ncbi:hypothetical protein ABER99_15400 [Paenibacillus glucanolyticus]|uniref:hypothetical protein n=2 Tax=Paenibacillus TaxID=44249 RepID=UPI0013E28DE1